MRKELHSRLLFLTNIKCKIQYSQIKKQKNYDILYFFTQKLIFFTFLVNFYLGLTENVYICNANDTYHS